MHNFPIVFRFEFRTLIQKKTVLVTTLLLCAGLLAVTSLPTIIKLFQTQKGTPDSAQTVLIANAAYVIEDPMIVQDELFAVLREPTPKLFTSKEALQEAVKQGEYRNGFVVHSLSSFTMIVQDKGNFDYSGSTMREVLLSYQKLAKLQAAGLAQEDIKGIMEANVAMETVVLGKDSMQGFVFAYVFMIVVYMLILLYGSSVSTSVAREKDSRTMELLITSTNPRELMLGKVFASGLVGFLQVGLMVLVTYLGYQLNASNYPAEITAMLQGSMSVEAVAVFVLFSVTGYFLYLFIYAALGSLVSKVEDVTSAVTPVTFLFVIAYLIASYSMQMPGSMITKISSFIPFVSIFTMPIRFMMVSVSLVEVGISLLLTIAAAYLMAYTSIYIYRAGSLNYGNRLRFTSMMKDMILRK